MSNLHRDATNHPTDLGQKNLHIPGYSVADAAARAALTTQVEPD